MGHLLQRNKGNFNIYYLGSVYQKTMRIVTRNNNTQIVRKPYWFVTQSLEKLEDLEKYWANDTCNL